jgi:hypothetical protein
MDKGDPIPSLDRRQVWIALFCELTIPEIPEDMEWAFSLEEEEERITDPLLNDICFAV